MKQYKDFIDEALSYTNVPDMTISESTDIKVNKTKITNTSTGASARVYYDRGGRVDGSDAITIYARDTINDLDKVFPKEYRNDSDMKNMDYHENGKVVIKRNHPLYKELEKYIK